VCESTEPLDSGQTPSTFERALQSGDATHLSDVLYCSEEEEMLFHLYRARDKEGARKSIEAKILPLLNSENVNSVEGGDELPLLCCFASDSDSLLAVVLNLEPDPDIISQSLHFAIRSSSTSPTSVRLLVDAGADTSFCPRLAFASSEIPEAFSGPWADESPLQCMFGASGFVKDDLATLEKIRLLLRAGAIVDYKGSGDKANTPLYWTIYNQDLKAVGRLLAHNADPNQLTHEDTPLVAYAAVAQFNNGKDEAEFEWFP
jgi:hypothetical protein